MKDTVSHSHATAALILADGSVFRGRGIGTEGTTGGEICFNTSMTGYQEIMTDPSYAGQIITFTFPHIGNAGVNVDDDEAARPFACGLVLKADITAPSNYRATAHFNDWLKERGLTGICGLDTRALTHHIREHGSQNAVISHGKDTDIAALRARVKELPPMAGYDMAKKVSTKEVYAWNQSVWSAEANAYGAGTQTAGHIVVVDYGVKRNILRCLAAQGFKLTIVPCDLSADKILALKPDGIFLSNGPGDPAATAAYAAPVIKDLLQSGLPLFGICLGHQLLAITLGGKTEKLPFGHRGANHPVKDISTGKIEITSQNHGFHVLPDSL
ncbi:MAG: glutamine-hydrolyzing carbamoyl-phosphate synthase small subunit, partial [Alphaproteobacteria bacterium]|nr:glutamine-hydrolyzing carbamoyl-phosphate synthase small subunit [Alphaproteobacteria bacterium]